LKRAIITVGLGFGDEGKGATVDYLAREFDADLVVRYCGGSQAGHNVELPDGRRHTFSQFGAGTLAPQRPRTYLGPATVIDPPALLREARHLADLGVPRPLQLITIHPHALVTTPWLKLLNRLRELARGTGLHGSCGMGIGEARHYWLRYGADAVFAGDLANPAVLHHKLELQRQRVLLEAQPLIEKCSPDALRAVGIEPWETSAAEVAEELAPTEWREVAIAAEVPPHETAIFEGAQGVLLDEYRGFHPYTTWSTVTPHHAWELVEQMGTEAVSVLGVTRAYTTRHGEGPLPTFSAELTARLADPGNPWNRWQGSLRCGWLDLMLLRYVAEVCGRFDGLAVNHLEQLSDGGCFVCESYPSGPLTPATMPDLAWQARLTEQVRNAEAVLVPATREELLRKLGEIAPVVVKGSGPTHRQRTRTELAFRKRRG
jgi:adenylosuccinate synthase